jgi:hypothetical protein
MAALPPIKRIMREDVKEAPKWIEKIIYPVNLFMDAVYSSLNRNLTFTENITSQVKSLSFETKSSYDGTAANWDDLLFIHNLPILAKGCLLLQIQEISDNYNPIENSVFINWIDINRTITINLITGLTASKKYNITFLVF